MILTLANNTINDVIGQVNTLTNNVLTNTNDISTAQSTLTILSMSVDSLTELQSDLSSLFNAKMDKSGGTFIGTVYGTTFRAAKGTPDLSNDSTRGFAFGNDGDTGLYAITGTSQNDTDKLGIYIQNSLKASFENSGNISITGIPTDSSHLTNKLYVDNSINSTKTYVDNLKVNMKLTGTTNVDVLGLGLLDNTPTSILDLYSDLSNSITFRTSSSNIQLKNVFYQHGTNGYSFGLDTSDNKFKLSANRNSLNTSNILSIDSNGNTGLTGILSIVSPNNTLGVLIKSSSGVNTSGLGIDSNQNSYFTFKDNAGISRIFGSTLDGSIEAEKLTLKARSSSFANLILKSDLAQSSSIDIISNNRSVTYDWRIIGSVDNSSIDFLYGGSNGTGYGKKFGITASGSLYTSGLWNSGPSAYVNDLLPKAYAFFTITGTTVTINSSFNISSITRNGAGDYTINFNTNLPSTNYVANINASSSAGTALSCGDNLTSQIRTITQYRFITATPSNNTNTEVKNCCVTILGG